MKESEKALEKKLASEVKKLGGWSIKLVCTFVAGLPDRLGLHSGKAYSCEMKSDGKKPSPIQRVIHKKLQAVGFTVYVIDNTEKLNGFLRNLEI